MAHHDAPDPPRSSPPVPARDGAPPPPTPVRASLGDEKAEAAHSEPPRHQVALEAAGVSWTVTVAGMSRSGAGEASAPILLVRFQPADDPGAVPREAWVVGRSLEDLTDLQVDAAFRESAPAPAAWTRKPLFPETGSRGGRDG